MLEGRREGGDFPLENTEILGHCSWLDINYWLYVYHVHTVPTVARRGWCVPRSWNYRELWTTMCILRTEPGSSAKPEHALNPWVICSITPLFSMTNFIPGKDDRASVCSARLQCVTLQWNYLTQTCETSKPQQQHANNHNLWTAGWGQISFLWVCMCLTKVLQYTR